MRSPWIRTLPPALALACLLLAGVPVLPGGMPRAASAEDLADKELAARIDKALEKATRFLASQQRRDGSWTYDGLAGGVALPGGKPRPHPHGRAGLTALAMHAMDLVQRFPEPFAQGAAWAEKNDALFGPNARWSTYSTGFLVCAHATHRSRGPHGIRMRAHAAQLVASQLESGIWNYGAAAQGVEALGDHSNTQVAVQALWLAQHEVGYAVPKATWKRVRDHFKACQLKDGSWGYRPAKGGRATGKTTKGTWVMTAAGLCSYALAAAALKGGGNANVVKARKDKVVVKAAAALEALGPPDLDDAYQVWLLERVHALLGTPLAEGWTPAAKHLLKTQGRSGGWRPAKGAPYGDSRGVYDTALRVLFLARVGRLAITAR